MGRGGASSFSPLLFARAPIHEVGPSGLESVETVCSALRTAVVGCQPTKVLALALVELFAKNCAHCGLNQLRTLLPLSSAFPASDSGREAQIAFLKSAIKWSSSVAPAGSAAGAGCPDLHLALARVYRAQKDYPAAHQQYLRSGGASELSQLSLPMDAAAAAPSWLAGSEYAEAATLLQEWASPAGGGLPSELDLFVARAVLQYLCVEDIAGATALLAHFRTHAPALADEPLLHFASFLTETCQRSREAAPLFDLLRHKYALALSRDPSLAAYLDKIGEIYFGQQAPKGLMESLLGGFGAQQSAQQQTSPSPAAPAPSASPAAATVDVPMASDVD